ncbi:Protein of unknown function [Microbacterium sp. ru370.1]|uniref:antitoxin Xre/MbcA/ParS toxin-binding domain-containing protein n=1 Tax=unclassified Microbacterium TaxID=2609290 RepID=UPI0008806076|nr:MULTISPECIES: antitoxin Xre/MbcA/ParS toxin-binding domain-containing protein [unclassified Microbacterium]SDO32785.1 Protein of unknown function [Microbacterium sp. ru370.1]SIT76871.1 Protein of unknown function [Microbacterium sp. RU1D]
MSGDGELEVIGQPVSVKKLDKRTVALTNFEAAKTTIRLLIDTEAGVYEVQVTGGLETALQSAFTSGWAAPTGLAELARAASFRQSKADAIRRLLEHAKRPKRSDSGLSQWDDLIGPFYKASAIAKWRNETRQNVSKLTGTGSLLGLRTSDNALLYPAFQFDEEGRLPPRFKELLRLLRSEITDDWTVALWLNNPQHTLDGRTPIELMRDPQQADRVFAFAHDEIARRSA